MRFRPVFAAAVLALCGCGALLGIDPIDYGAPGDAGADDALHDTSSDSPTDGASDEAAPSLDGAAEAAADAGSRCDAAGPVATQLVRLGLDGGGEPTFLTTLGSYLVWSNNDPGGYMCDPGTCANDGGVLRIQHGSSPTLGLAGGGSVLVLAGDQDIEHCLVTAAPIGCSSFSIPMFAAQNPTITSTRMFIDALRQADAGAASIIDCALGGPCSTATDAFVSGTLTARTTRLRATGQAVVWTDTQRAFLSCSLTLGCAKDAGGPSAVLPPSGGAQLFDMTSSGAIVAATIPGEVAVCDALPCKSWRPLARVGGPLVELIVDEHAAEPEVIWSTVDGTVRSCSLASCGCPRVLGTGMGLAHHLAATPSEVYVTSSAFGGTIYRVPR